MKRLISLVLSLLLIATVLTAFGTASASGDKKITDTNPAITADVGEKITLSDYSVVFAGDKDATSDIDWKDENGKAVSDVTPDKKGVTKLTASSGSKNMNVYVVAKEKNETEYVLFEDDYSKYSSINELRSNGYVLPSNDLSCSLKDGNLVLGNLQDGYARVILPEWLGDFGDYSITTEAKMLETADTGRWFGLVYRIQNKNKAYYPYYHMCVREATTASNGIEFAERTSGDSWNVAVTASGDVSSMKNGFHTLNVIAYGTTVQYNLDGKSVVYANDAVLGGTAALYTKGGVGFTMNYGAIAIKNVKITVQQSVPERPVKVLDLMVNDHEALNLINQIANVQLISGANANDTVASENAPGSIMIKASEISDLDAFVAKCVEKQILPTFIVESKEEVALLDSAMTKAKTKDANVVSADASLLDLMRKNISTVRTGLIVDIDGELTEKTANDIRIKVRKAPATFCVIKSEDASHNNVDELQELALSVWVEVASKSDSADFTVEALRAVTSGANGIITDNAGKLAEVINTYLAEKTLTKTPIMIGHRGNPGVAPENTLSGFIKAYENGADVFEVDVEVTKDGEVIIMHDGTLNRTTTYKGNLSVGQMTLEQIKAEFILGKDGKATTEKVPTLDEVLDYFKDKDCKIFVEFKGGNALNIKNTCDLIKKYGMEHKIDVISFNTGFLNQTVNANNIPGMSTGYLHSVSGSAATEEDAIDAFYKSLTTAQTFKSSINPGKGVITKYYLQAAADRGMTVWPWTYNASNNNVGFLSGCDGVTTDDMQWVTKMAKYLTVAENTDLAVGASTDLNVKAVSYGGTETVIAKDKLMITVLSGEDCIEIKDGAIKGIKDGVATVMYGYTAKTTQGSPYVIYTQPVTVTVGNTGSDEASADASVGDNSDNADNADGESNGTVIIIVCIVIAIVAIGGCVIFVSKKKK